MRVEIPENLARELSDLLTQHSIRMQVLSAIAGKPEEYEKIEKTLIPISQRIDEIKYMITSDYIPKEFQSDAYQWNFNGYAIDKNTISIEKV